MKNKGMKKLIRKSKVKRTMNNYKPYLSTIALSAPLVISSRELHNRRYLALQSSYNQLNDFLNEYRKQVNILCNGPWYKRVWYRIKRFFRNHFKS